MDAWAGHRDLCETVRGLVDEAAHAAAEGRHDELALIARRLAKTAHEAGAGALQVTCEALEDAAASGSGPAAARALATVARAVDRLWLVA